MTEFETLLASQDKNGGDGHFPLIELVHKIENLKCTLRLAVGITTQYWNSVMCTVSFDYVTEFLLQVSFLLLVTGKTNRKEHITEINLRNEQS